MGIGITVLLLLCLGALCVVIGAILLIVAAFRESVGWGLAVIFIPFASLVFLFKHWDAAKVAFLFQAGGIALVGVLFSMGLLSGINLMRRAVADGLVQKSHYVIITPTTNFVAEAPAPAQAAETPADAPAAPLAEPAGEEDPKDPMRLRGRSLDDVVKIMGPPRGRMLADQRVCLLYPGFSFFSDDGRTISSVQRESDTVPWSAAVSKTPPAKGSRAKPPPDRAPAKTAATGSAPPKTAPKAEKDAGDVKVISNGGQRVDLSSLLVPAKVTIVDFYADWCGPCRQLSPHLEQMAREDPDVVLRKVNIVNWGTEVCHQFNISSVPNVRVFDRQGRMVGQPTHQLDSIASSVSAAK